MLVKTFEGLTTADAMKSVKKEFGNEAVILSTKQKFSEDTGTQITEITAASAEQKIQGAATAANSGAEAESISTEKWLDIQKRISNLQKNMITREELHTIETGMQEIKLLLLESLRQSHASLHQNASADILNTLEQLKVMGIDPAHISKLKIYLESTEPSQIEKNQLSEFYRAKAIEWMHGKITIAPSWNLMKGNTAVHMFVGPSGSGKSSLVVKLAERYRSEGHKVLLASFDQEKIAANEQLRIYSKILGIDFMTFESATELESKIIRKREYELVLIDSGGRNPRVLDHLSDLQKFQEIDIPIDMHLVLSLTEKQSQLDRAIRAFASVGVHTLNFTKLDESWTYGEVYNMGQKWSLPLGFFTTGQKIPGAIERATKERVLERIFCL